ncbi:MAG: hypothetical protein CMJ33_07975 [Phycisphaerae bacterium]|nr:hypothetical protein [Phycisphaerae bacterium]
MTAGSRIVIALVVLAFLGTGLYYLAISEEEGVMPAITPAVSEPTPAPVKPVEDVLSKSGPVAEQTLAFRVPVSPSDPIDLANALEQLQVPGWRNVPGAPVGWYALERLDAFFSSDVQKDALDRDPATYLRERFGLIASPSGGKLFVLLHGTSGKSLVPARRRGVDVMAVSIESGQDGKNGLDVELGANTSEMFKTLQARNVSRSWAVLVDDVVIDVARIDALEDASLVIGAGFDTSRLSSIKAGILGTSRLVAAEFDPIAPTEPAAAEPEREILLAASTTVAQTPEYASSSPRQETAVQESGRRKQVSPTPAVAGAGMTEYVVQEGDTLADISENWFGLRGKWSLVVDANPGLDPSRLSIGQVLMLPPKSMASRSTKAAETRDVKGTYLVKEGDNLSKIAFELYGSESYWKLIYEANEALIGKDPAALSLGQRLVIPPKPSR